MLYNDFSTNDNGYTKEEALLEAKRCLSCKNPRCETGCPTSMKIRDFIKELKNENITEAANIISECSSLSAICSRVCHHEKQCVGHCILNAKGKPIEIGKLERFINDEVGIPYNKADEITGNVAVIGGGPASISCAKVLAQNGVNVTLFDNNKYLGGVMVTGIPNFRLNKDIVANYYNELKELGVLINLNTEITYDDIIHMKDEYDFIFLGTGLTKVKKLQALKEDLEGIYDALDLLKISNLASKYNIGDLPKLSGKTIVIGAGNVAMDASRMALRLGSSEVSIVYRRSIDEAPASKAEIDEALHDGVIFKFLTNPVKVIGDIKVQKLLCEKMILEDADETGRRTPVGSNDFFEIECDNIISAIGQNPDNLYANKDIETNGGYLIINPETYETSDSKIYAGGDIALGPQTVVKAMVSGRVAAKEIINRLK